MSLDQAFFLAVALFGALFLVASFLLGTIGDFFDSVGDAVGDHLDFGGEGDAPAGDHAGGDLEGPSPLSLRNLMAFMTAYGASGLITSSYGWSTLASSLFGLLPGVGLALVAFKFMQALYGQQSNSVVEVGGLLGHAGIIDLAIPAAGIGRVTVNTGSGQSTFLARSEGGAPIAAGERVIVKATMGSDLIVSRAQDST